MHNKAKLLNLSNFSWEANDLSLRFQGSQSPEAFVSIFEEIDSHDKATDSSIRSANSSTADGDRTEPPPNKKTRVLMPANYPPATSTAYDEKFDETKMDDEIESHFQG